MMSPVLVRDDGPKAIVPTGLVVISAYPLGVFTSPAAIREKAYNLLGNMEIVWHDRLV
jgi:hypothetical protein